MHLCISVRWLDDRFHGLLGRHGPPEWPPSPFRLFQALVAGVARRGKLDSEIRESLLWLEKVKEPPLIIAPKSRPGQVITRFVPNNDSDAEPDRQKRLTGKTCRPTLPLERPEIHYIWPIEGESPHLASLIEASHCLTCLGWGIDMAFAQGRTMTEGEIEKLRGVRWRPKADPKHEDGLLRTPEEGTVADLCLSRALSLRRIEHGKPLKTVRKPSVFNRAFYASAERPLGRPYVVFALRTDEDEFDPYPHSKLMHISGMTRNAAITAMKEYPPDGHGGAWIDSFVAGHSRDHDGHKQFSYVPIPSIGHVHADAMVRRAMIVAPFGYEAELQHLSEQLDGVRLKPEGGGEGAVLSGMRPDSVVRRYVGTSKAWASVTPVILPGHDDHKAAKTIKLIERALRQSGVDQPCRFTWGAIPNFANCLPAYKHDRNGRHLGYFRPSYLDSMTMVHLRLEFQSPLTGPLAVGAGRHCGFGVFGVQRE